MQILLRNFVLNFMVCKQKHDSISFSDFTLFLILDPNEWADIFAASGAKYVSPISLS
jgi:hypothetical protein